MAERDWDAVIVGAGHNGLVAANILADRGWSVVVAEAAEQPGGAVQSAELIEAGFVNDLCSAFYPLGIASPVLNRLQLERYGLRWRWAPLVLAHPARDGTCPVLSTDLDETMASLDAHHPGDGQAWAELHQLWSRVRAPLLESILGPFPPVRAGARVAAVLRRDLLRFARFMVLPVRRLGEEHFGGEAARRLVAGAALHADLSPEAALGGFYGWLLCMLGQDVGFPVPEGGAGRLTGALVARLAERGGEIRCARPVGRVLTAGGRAVGVRTEDGEELRAGRAVLADVDAVTLYCRLVGPDRLPPRFVDELRHFHRDRSTIKVDWTLDRPVPWLAEGARRAGTVHLSDDVDALTVNDAELVRGLLPSRPFVLVGQQSMTDPSRQPPGCETLWAYAHLPRHFRGDARGELAPPWTDATAERMADRIQAEIEELAPGFEAAVRGRHVLDPAGLEAHDRSLVDGAINGGTSQLHQQLVFRPVPGSGRPGTPIAGLYLASASAHPGGGVHGAPGANAARAALLDARLGRLRA